MVGPLSENTAMKTRPMMFFGSHNSLTVIVVMMQISLFKLTKPGS